MGREAALGGWRELISPKLAPRASLVVLGIWLNAADGLVTVTLMPSVVRELGGAAYYGWAVAAFLVASIAAGASAGQLSARWGLRRACFMAALAYTGGCAASAAAGGMLTFLAGRALQGLGSGWIIGFCYVAIESLFENRFWPKLLAAGAAAWGVASLIGPLIGGLFADSGHWRGAFWFFAVQGAVFALASLVLMRTARKADSRASGVAWRTLAVLIVSILLIGAANVTPALSTSLALLAAGVLVFLVSIVVNAQPAERLFPLSVARPWTAAGAGYATIFFLEVGTVALNVYEAAVLQTAYGLSPALAGYTVCAMAMGWTAAAFVASNVSERRGGVYIRIGAGLVLAGYAIVTATIARSDLVWVIAGNLVMGSGFGACWSILTKRTVDALPGSERTVGASAIPTTQLMGGAVGAAMAGSVGNLLGLSRGLTPDRAETVAPLVFAAFVPFVAIGSLAALRLARSTSGQDASHRSSPA